MPPLSGLVTDAREYLIPMADELIDGHVSVKQCKRAVTALMEYALKQQQKREENELLSRKEEYIWLQISVKRVHAEAKLKPRRIPIKYPLVDPRDSAVCLITKDPQREYKDLLEQAGVKFVNRVVGVEKLKGKFKPFEARRALLRENALFLADDRVIPLLPRLLGKIFFTAKKQPIPVSLSRKDLKGELERAISSTYMHQNRGTCTSVKIGTLSQSPAQVLANLQTALPAIIAAVRGGWDNVQSLSIKSSKSTSLPIWSCKLGNDDGARWHGLTLEAEEVLGEKQKRAAEVSEPPTQKKLKKSPSESTTLEILRTSKPRKESKASPLSSKTDIKKVSPSLTKDVLTKDELKQKRRSGTAGEKKKEKLVKGHGGMGTAKKALIGRKAREPDALH
ncbi:ribosomal protein L1p/L10e family-domain-containing protein [Lactarius akahatsu]|uniref:Ribosomal L1 domain-containing protein 1 n=1 Tax=Lactarius akahatsu TaxID=416441 RepID=A0AAD4Q5Q3_9AGAM|nr:ribosomal protein L1p/L10e family-domain-containing protein [Lactarius akahatsu]